MRNIVLARIDDRLIHGQIMTAWLKTTVANQIVIADDSTYKNAFTSRLLKAIVPAEIKVVIQDVKGAGEYLSENSIDSTEKIILLTKSPEAMELLINAGIKLPTIVLGNMGYKQGRKSFSRNVSVSPDEMATIQRILESGTEMYYQMIPADERVNVKKILNK